MNHAARVKSTAAAGQVVVSSKTWNSCTRRDDFVELDLGELILKGVEEPMNLFQISRKVCIPSCGLDFSIIVPSPLL